MAVQLVQLLLLLLLLLMRLLLLLLLCVSGLGRLSPPLLLQLQPLGSLQSVVPPPCGAAGWH